MEVGDSFHLECIATNDPQSPNMLKFKWFRGSSKIFDRRSGWVITDFMDSDDNNKVTFNSILFRDMVDHQHNGRYTCSVYDSMITTDIEQSTNVIVESKHLQHVT